MTDRFSLRPLYLKAFGSLRVRKVHEREPLDWAAVAILFVPPGGLGILSAALQWRVREADALIAGFALLAAALLAVFVQLASWRDRLRTTGKHSALVAYEGPSRRSIDEAVAHTLWASLLSVLGASLLVVLANISAGKADESVVLPWVATALTAMVVALSAYLILTFVLIVNLLFDAYEGIDPEEADEVAREDARRK